MMKRRTSRCTALAFVAFAPVVGSAADQCKVNNTVVGVWNGAAEYMGGRPTDLTAPQAQVPVRQIILKPPGVAASASPGASTYPSDAGPTSESKFAPKPPRPEPKNDQERLFNAALGELLSSPRLDGCGDCVCSQIQIDHPTPTVYNPEPLLGYDEHPPPPRTGHRTSLMYAAAAGNAEICKILIEHGANTREADAEGKSALDYAKSAEVRIELQAPRSTR